MRRQEEFPVEVEKIPWESLGEGSSLLQSTLWASHKSAFGWKPYGFRVDKKPMLLLWRGFPLGRGIGYVPRWSPEGDDRKTGHYLSAVTAAILPHLPKKSVFIRYDLDWEIERGPDPVGEHMTPLKKGSVDIQPPDSVLVDISDDEETILSRMKQKTRYNIRLAPRKGVTVRVARPEEGAVWYRLYRETAARDRIAIHPEAYYTSLLTAADMRPADAEEGADRAGGNSVLLLLAEYQGMPIGGIIVSIWGNRATYLYGASADEHRNLMASYLLQWEGMLRARAAGCLSYDMFGIPPDDDTSHPMHGLYRFKTGFGGRIVHMAGCWDAPARALEYGLYSVAERVRTGYYKGLLKRMGGRR